MPYARVASISLEKHVTAIILLNILYEINKASAPFSGSSLSRTIIDASASFTENSDQAYRNTIIRTIKPMRTCVCIKQEGLTSSNIATISTRFTKKTGTQIMFLSESRRMGSLHSKSYEPEEAYKAYAHLRRTIYIYIPISISIYTRS